MLPGCKGGGDLMARLAPCKDCPDRTCGDRVHDCHDTCERYQAFKASCIAKNKARMAYWMARTATLEGMRRMKNNPPPGPSRKH